MTERLKHMKEVLMCAAEEQLTHLEDVDANELGEVIDMIKDIEEAEYYCAVTKAMHESEEYEYSSRMNYPIMYYGGKGTDHYDWSAKGSGVWENSKMNHENGNMIHEREMHNMHEDPKEGRSYKARRMYMESKETHQDKTAQMKELEKYAQELTSDMIEMVEDASPEERQYLSKKVTALANKITQLNTNV